MTTKKAEAYYLARHMYEMEEKRWAIYNPRELPVEELPVIYGFNNGGAPGWYTAQLIAEDGTCLGSHICSHEGYMEHDLGILEGSRPDRHVHFKQYYPNGYRMEFVGYAEAEIHEGLNKAFKLYQKKAAAQGDGDGEGVQG